MMSINIQTSLASTKKKKKFREGYITFYILYYMGCSDACFLENNGTNDMGTATFTCRFPNLMYMVLGIFV